MAKLGFTIEGDLVSGASTYTLSSEDAGRVLAYGGRRFSTVDPNEIVARFADLFIGNLLSDVRASEQQLAAAKAADEVPELTATPDQKV